MKCQKCGNEYPSKFYFKTNHICFTCYDKLPQNERNLLDATVEDNSNSRTKKVRLPSALKTILAFFYVLAILSAFYLMTTFFISMVNPDYLTLNSLHDFNLIYKFTPAEFDQELITKKINNSIPISEIDIKHLALVNFKMQSRIFVLLYFSGSLLFLGIFFILIYQLRAVLSSLEIGSPFVFENAKRIKIIGWAIILGQLLGLIWIFSFAFYLNTPAELGEKTLSIYWTYISEWIDHASWQIVLGMVILAIGGVFRYGTELRNEQALTI